MPGRINPNSNSQLAIKARETGKSTFIGSPCIHCGNRERRAGTSTSPCIVCDRERVRKAYAENPASRIAMSGAWARKNRDYLNAYKRARHQLKRESENGTHNNW